MTSVAVDLGRPAPRPGWLRVSLGILVGYVIAGAVLVAATGIASLAGAASAKWTTSGEVGVLDWPYPRAGAWSVLSNLVVLATVLVVTAVLVARAVAAL